MTFSIRTKNKPDGLLHETAVTDVASSMPCRGVEHALCHLVGGLRECSCYA